MDDIKTFLKSRQKLNLILVVINILVYVGCNLVGNTSDARCMLNYGACYAPAVMQDGQYYRLITSMFLHFSAQHIFYNMLLLLFLGDSLEKYIGKIRYLIIYFAGGICGNLLSLFMETHTEEYILSRGKSAVVSAGASGAIFAVLGAMIWIVIQNKGRLENYSLRRMGLMVVLSVADGFMNSGTDNFAHIGGLLSGFFLSFLLCTILHMKIKK